MKTISIFLPNGNPNGIKVVEVSNRLVRAICVPRAMLNESRSRTELLQPSLYVLCEKDGNNVYIGESENFYERVKHHDQQKEFWDTAIAFVSKDNSLEKGDIKYLECLAVERGKEAGRYILKNKTAPIRNNLHEFKLPMINEFFEDMKLVIATLGYPIFEKVTTEKINNLQLWYCELRNSKLIAVYDENGMTILKDSILSKDPVESYESTEARNEIIKEYCIEKNGELILKESYTFNSPSGALKFAIGANING